MAKAQKEQPWQVSKRNKVRNFISVIKKKKKKKKKEEEKEEEEKKEKEMKTKGEGEEGKKKEQEEKKTKKKKEKKKEEEKEKKKKKETCYEHVQRFWRQSSLECPNLYTKATEEGRMHRTN